MSVFNMQSNVFFLFYGLLLEAAAVGKLTTALKHGGNVSLVSSDTQRSPGVGTVMRLRIM